MMAYPSYYDLSTKPVRRHPIPTYFEDPEEATDYHALVALRELGEEQREARRRIVTALANRLSNDAGATANALDLSWVAESRC